MTRWVRSMIEATAKLDPCDVTLDPQDPLAAINDGEDEGCARRGGRAEVQSEVIACV